jgi:hypothetical protein
VLPRIPPLAEVLPVELTAHTAPKWPECTAARARIEGVRIRAQKAFFRAIRRNLKKPPKPQEDHFLFRNYIMAVWFVLVCELCLLGRRRKWQHKLPADRIGQCSEQFLERFTIFIAHPEDGRDRYGRPLEGVIEYGLGHSPNLSPSFWKMIKQHKFWHAGQAELLAVSDHQGGKRKNRIARQLAAIEKNYTTAIGRNIKWLSDDCSLTFKAFAAAAGVDERNVTRHTSGGQNASIGFLERYAQTFTKKLGRTVTVEELKTWPPKFRR